MHELLEAGYGTRGQALDACRRYLARSWPRWRWAERFLPAARRDGLVAVLTWQRLTRELAGWQGFERRRGLDLLRRELDLAQRERARSAAGTALSWALRRYALEAAWLGDPVSAWARDEHLATFETRAALLAHARALAAPEGRALLAVLERRSPRREVLAETLAVALQLTTWVVGLRDEFAAGRLRLPLDVILRTGVDLTALFEPGGSGALATLLGDEVVFVRGLYAKGWPLCRELGPWEGRLLAFVLRWNAASLSALEFARFQPRPGGPPAGWPRLVTCGLAGLATRGAPRL